MIGWVAAVAEATLRLTPFLVVVLGLARPRLIPAPRLRHAALVAGLLATLVAPLLVLLLPGFPVPFLPFLRILHAPEPAMGSAFAADTGSVLVALSWVAAWIWGAGTLALLARLGWGLDRLRRLAAAATPLAAPPHCHVGGRARTLVSAAVDGPVTFGLRRTVVVMPPSATGWPPEQLRAVLAHEMAHVRHRDAWARLLMEATIALHWPNPLVWLLARAAREVEEEACDDAVLDAGIAPVAYAEMLVGLSGSPGGGPARGLAAGVGARRGLERRVRRLLERSRSHRRSRGAGAALAVTVVALGGVAALVHPTPPRSGSGTDMPLDPAREAGAFGIDPLLARRIMDAAEREGLDYGLGFGLVSVESGFDAGRVSPSGALGLVQIRPATASSVAPGIPRDALLDPDVNLRVGFRLLGRHLARFAGDRQRALVAYNSGVLAAERVDVAGDTPALRYARRVLQAAAQAASMTDSGA